MIGIYFILRLEGCIIHLTAEKIPLGKNRKRGAPKKARPALIRQLSLV